MCARSSNDCRALLKNPCAAQFATTTADEGSERLIERVECDMWAQRFKIERIAVDNFPFPRGPQRGNGAEIAAGLYELRWLRGGSLGGFLCLRLRLDGGIDLGFGNRRRLGLHSGERFGFRTLAL